MINEVPDHAFSMMEKLLDHPSGEIEVLLKELNATPAQLLEFLNSEAAYFSEIDRKELDNLMVELLGHIQLEAPKTIALIGTLPLEVRTRAFRKMRSTFVYPVQSIHRKPSLTKTKVVRMMAIDAGITQSEARKALEALLGTLEATLAEKKKITIRGFGSWKVAEAMAEDAVPLDTGKAKKKGKTEPKNVVRFEPSEQFLESKS